MFGRILKRAGGGLELPRFDGHLIANANLADLNLKSE